MSKPSKPSYQFGPFRLDTAEQVLWRDDQAVALTPKVFGLLLALVEKSGHVVEKEELMQRVWPDAIVEKDPGIISPPGFAVSPDGRWILFKRIDQSDNDILLVENFR